MKPLLIFFTLMFVFCEKPIAQKIAPIKPFPDTTLILSEEHHAIFPWIEKKSYTNESATELFSEFVKKGDRYCNVIFNNHAYNTKEFSTQLNKYSGMMSKLLAGCFNFYTMNDIDAKKDFVYLNAYYSGTKDCYTVGFSQAYIMAGLANCETLNMIDVDWRILEAHNQMLNMMKRQEFDVKNIKVGWTAYGSKRAVEKSSLGLFCDVEDYKTCKRFFSEFKNIYPTLSSVELQVSFLHTAIIAPKKTDTVVVYVSNAIDPGYTSQSQFDTMLKNISENLVRNDQRAIIIYHGGGATGSAIYEIRKDKKVKTICRDNIKWSAAYGRLYGTNYKTYLDKIATPAGNNCTTE